jgi:hypothetical protein
MDSSVRVLGLHIIAVDYIRLKNSAIQVQLIILVTHSRGHAL